MKQMKEMVKTKTDIVANTSIDKVRIISQLICK